MVCRKLYSYCSYWLVTKGVHLKVSWGCTLSCPPALTAQHIRISFGVLLTRDMFNQWRGKKETEEENVHFIQQENLLVCLSRGNFPHFTHEAERSDAATVEQTMPCSWVASHASLRWVQRQTAGRETWSLDLHTVAACLSHSWIQPRRVWGASWWFKHEEKSVSGPLGRLNQPCFLDHVWLVAVPTT